MEKERREEEERRKGRKKEEERKEEENAHPYSKMTPVSCCTSSTPSSSPELEEKATPSTFFNLEFPWSPSSISLHATSLIELLPLELPQGMVRTTMASIFILPNPGKFPHELHGLPW